ncbi:MAG: hypothetical protein JW954_00260 [Dehalococcoidaceae bacterium]|nr:hypothetical protein [Dehalococcoidaceae bacterium]
MGKLTAIVLVMILAGLPVLSACTGDGLPESSIVILHGQEDTAEAFHLLALNVAKPPDNRLEQTVQGRIDDINAAGGLAIICHPDTYGFTNDAKLRQLEGYIGMELGSAQSTHRWDSLLTYRLNHAQPLVWGFMTDDMHYSFQAGWGITMVKTTELTSQALLDALKTGSFYWGSAPLISDIALVEDTISITLNTEAEIRFIKSNGETALETAGAAITASYQIRGDEGYIRAETRTASGKVAGTQPFRVISAGEIQNPYAGTGQWYKGNIHTHTTESDGELAPNEAALLYEEKGYDFLGITDHVSWVIPVESEARIQGRLYYDGNLDNSVVWIGAREAGKQEFCSKASVEINGPGFYEYTLPYIPDGMYTVSAILNASGYYLPADSADTLATGEYAYFITIDGPGAYENIDFVLVDKLP